MIFTTIGQAKKQTGLSYLGGINISSKMIKNKKVSGNYTYIIYLAPANQSGYNVCLFSTPECRLGCLATSGAEIQQAQRKAIKAGYDFSVRLNGTSDIDWANIKLDGANIFQHFPSVQFYDYTKQYLKMADTVSNYHLTFSYSGHNTRLCKLVLEQGKNIAVVFDVKKGKALPETFMGYPVVDGDLTDFRVNDPKGCVVGLRFKKIADKDVEKIVLSSVFVVKP